MSRENVEAFRRFADANNRRDVDAMLEELDADVEWRSAILGSLGGEATVHRGHGGVREMLRDLYEAFSEFQVEFSEIREGRQGDSGPELPRSQGSARSRGLRE